ncbi:hypothetical protein KIN20_007219 [Parelaphostrongylus tenuis]|uniref:Uncharacterized protein n=1 Tax=Parelaphostrongylus tenuis TaxID=148309 RepID=A0AAD5M7I3_PARTN|nr:hypothetical protein KIN20_007219 [Parelaphostrongylus tenuis]
MDDFFQPLRVAELGKWVAVHQYAIYDEHSAATTPYWAHRDAQSYEIGKLNSLYECLHKTKGVLTVNTDYMSSGIHLMPTNEIQKMKVLNPVQVHKHMIVMN